MVNITTVVRAGAVATFITGVIAVFAIRRAARVATDDSTAGYDCGHTSNQFGDTAGQHTTQGAKSHQKQSKDAHNPSTQFIGYGKLNQRVGERHRGDAGPAAETDEEQSERQATNLGEHNKKRCIYCCCD